MSGGQDVPNRLEYTPNSPTDWNRPLLEKPVALPRIESVTTAFGW